MYRLVLCFIIILNLCMNLISARAEKNWGINYYNIGVFLYEEGDYDKALKHLKKANQLNPTNAHYIHYLGKTYMQLQMYDEAGRYLYKAQQIKPDLYGLKYDIALLKYNTSFFSKAAKLFIEIINENPSNTLSQYHAGMCFFKQKKYRKAAKYFNKVLEENSSIKSKCSYYLGIIYYKTGDINKAAEHFQYVKTNSISEDLRQEALQWLRVIENKQNEKSYKLFIKLSTQFDDNIGLLVINNNIDQNFDEDQFTRKSDFITEGYLAFNYNLVKANVFQFQVGLNHFERMHLNSDHKEFNLSGSIFNLSSSYDYYPFSISLHYFPTYCRRGSERYLDRQEFQPELFFKLSESTVSRVYYRFDKDNYKHFNNKNGVFKELHFDLYHNLKIKEGYLFGGIGIGGYSASNDDHSYNHFKVRAGISLNLIWNINMNFIGKFFDKNFDKVDSYYEMIRNDEKFFTSISFTKQFIYDWLSLSLEHQYINNHSNIKYYEYVKNLISASIVIKK